MGFCALSKKANQCDQIARKESRMQGIVISPGPITRHNSSLISSSPTNVTVDRLKVIQ